MSHHSSVLVAASLLAAALAIAPSARADIDPPAGLDWLRRYKVEIDNVDAYRDYVLVAFPCFGDGASADLDSYCVIQSGAMEFGLSYGVDLFALAKREFAVAYDPKGGFNGGAWIFTKPKIDDTNAFFESDPRVARPGFPLTATWSKTIPWHSAIRTATFGIHIDGIDERGVAAHFTRVKWVCTSGLEVELPWDPKREDPPLPACPVTDDHGDVIAPDNPGATSSLPVVVPPPLRGRERRFAWLGVLVASVSMLCGGLLLRKPAS